MLQNFSVMEFSHELMLKKKGTASSLSEAVFIFTQREDTQVSTSNSIFWLEPSIAIFSGARVLPAPSIWMSGRTEMEKTKQKKKMNRCEMAPQHNQYKHRITAQIKHCKHKFRFQ